MKIWSVSLLVLLTIAACNSGSEPAGTDDDPWQEQVALTVNQIRSIECLKPDSTLVEEGLDEATIAKARAFCALPIDEMIAEVAARFHVLDSAEDGVGQTTQQVYSCYYNGANFDIPTYADLGLTDATCVWHDPNPGCKVQGLVACLWGCSNNDPVLGWHTKWYASRSALEADIFPKGYATVSSGVFGEGGGYRRTLPRGYSYQVHSQSIDANGQGYWHCEGPEPDTRFSWYAWYGGWYPSEVQSWHAAC